jgi:hypothetical protein
MTEIRVYKKTDFTPLATLREDIVMHIRDIFPAYRSFVENISIYNDEKEEVLFFTNTGRLAYVKILSSNGVQLIDYVIDDYLKVQERWTRFAKNDQRYKGHLSSAIEMVVIAEHFDVDFIKRVRFLIAGKVTLLEVRTLKSSAGEIAYSLSEIMTLKSSETQTTATAEPVVFEPAVEQVPEPPFEENVLPEQEERVADDFEMPTIEPEEAEALRSSLDGPRRESDFFERAQLNAEEEHEFFLLNQQLSENTERKKN